MMKKIVGMVCTMLLLVSAACARDKVTKDVSLLPVEARGVIEKHFPGATVSYLKVDNNLFAVEGYDVWLSDGSELEFDRKGQWTEVETKRKPVPQSLIPEPIRKYMNRFYGEQRVTKIKHNRRGYELKLANGLEVEFDNQGHFLRLDD